MTPKLDSSQPIATFELLVPSAQAELFFKAVGWKLENRPKTPPTLATAFRQGEFAALQKMNIPLEHVLHGEQRYSFHKELEADQKYFGKTYLKSHYEKSGTAGKMDFYSFQTDLFLPNGELCVECLTLFIVRRGL